MIVDKLAAQPDMPMTVTVLLSLAKLDGLRISEPSLRRAIGTLQRKGIIALRKGPPKFWGLADAVKREREREERSRARAERKERARERADREQQRQHEEFRRTLARKRRTVDPAAETLARILGMLGSNSDGECLAAARKVEAARKKTGRTWQQLFGLE